MTPNQIETVKDSFQRVAPVALSLSLTFYAELFRIAPSVRPYFPSEMHSQRVKLVDTLSAVVLNLHQLHALNDTIAGLAKRHVEYGARPEHFAPVGHALIYALKQTTPNGLTPVETEAWVAAYGEITDMMVDTMVNSAA
ncbi:globin domain-containing protein [Cognatiyoonia sp. IB215446]|uniref:globin domain-containing protein n=1 Tax=Cognatiyoonia sp. IB215446 TaxID=3097355 RepID=UPI002A0B624F|nr:globin domain-containing protein [Cognatiyoonia sp. IB215446]MDX8348226.1 globin domain-containing protein [Cognatiyoonia sp. IB215446]